MQPAQAAGSQPGARGGYVNEQLIGGGRLVRLNSGNIATEKVPGARRGLVVYSASSHLDGSGHYRGSYTLTKRVSAGTDLWHVQRNGKVEAYEYWEPHESGQEIED